MSFLWAGPVAYRQSDPLSLEQLLGRYTKRRFRHGVERLSLLVQLLRHCPEHRAPSFALRIRVGDRLSHCFRKCIESRAEVFVSGVSVVQCSAFLPASV